MTSSTFNPQPPTPSRKEYVLVGKCELEKLKDEIAVVRKEVDYIKTPLQPKKVSKSLVFGATASTLLGAGYALFLLWRGAHGQSVDLSLIVLTIVISNSMAQIFVDFFPSEIKAKYSALARVVPVVAAFFAYFK